MAAILLNFEIGKVNFNFIEQGWMLSWTLLPYLNKTLDYTFMAEETAPLVNQYLTSLI